MTNIAFAGLGSMGRPLARLLAESPFDLAVYDPLAAASEVFKGKARIAHSPREAASEADIACVCVRDDKQVVEVLFGEDGMASSLKEGALVMIISTISVEALMTIDARLREQGVTLVDAPVSRTGPVDDEPFVFTMFGGSQEDVERATPVAEIFSTATDHMGALGAGMATKISNNLITWTQIVVGIQSIELARRNGVDLDKLLNLMRSNGNLTPPMNGAIVGKFLVPHSAERDALFTSQGGIGAKDLALALDSAMTAGLDVSLIREAQAIVADAMSRPVGSG